GTLILAALVMGIVNALVKPLAVVLTLPITIVTLGIFLLVVNAAMFALVAWILPGFSVSGFWAALFGWLIVSVVSCVASSLRDRTGTTPRRLALHPSTSTGSAFHCSSGRSASSVRASARHGRCPPMPRPGPPAWTCARCWTRGWSCSPARP